MNQTRMNSEIAYCIEYYSLQNKKIYDNYDLSNDRSQKEAPKFLKISNKEDDPSYNNKEKLLAEFLKEENFFKCEILGAVYLFFNFVESEDIPIEIRALNLWVLFKVCLFISQKLCSDVSYKIDEFCITTDTNKDDLSILEVHLVLLIFKWNLGINGRKIEKTEKFLEKIAILV